MLRNADLLPERSPVPRVRLGPWLFDLGAAGHFKIPPLVTHPLFRFEGSDVEAAMEGDQFYLLIDHRSDAPRTEVARVELWESFSPGETGNAVLLVICEASGSSEGAVSAMRLGDIVGALRGRNPLH